MSTSVTALLLAGSVLVTLLLSTLTYALRDFSRAKLIDLFSRRGREEKANATVERASEFAVVCGIGRLIVNMVLLLAVLDLVTGNTAPTPLDHLLALLLAGVLGLVVSVLLPHTLADHFGEVLIVLFITPLNAGRVVFMPVLKALDMVDNVVRRAAGGNQDSRDEEAEDDFEQEILSLAEEAEEEGVVDEHGRELIESVIEFRDSTAGQIMTARPDIDALPVESTLDEVRERIEASGHSRIPIYEGSLDKLVGVIYARDLMHYVGVEVKGFDIRALVRQPMFVPETKSLQDLLQDFRLQKVHMAIVLDEHGSVNGLVTIEDVLEEIVGEISDEHEPAEPAQFARLSDTVAEADGRLRIDELNRLFGLELPEDAGYGTIGGFISTTLGEIPRVGTTLTDHGVTFTVIDAEPQRINRVRLELQAEPAVEEAPVQ